jgi:hypothetical protein
MRSRNAKINIPAAITHVRPDPTGLAQLAPARLARFELAIPRPPVVGNLSASVRGCPESLISKRSGQRRTSAENPESPPIAVKWVLPRHRLVSVGPSVLPIRDCARMRDASRCFLTDSFSSSTPLLILCISSAIALNSAAREPFEIVDDDHVLDRFNWT